jgi:general secretion pathway protein L
MTLQERILEAFSRWMDNVADAIVAVIEKLGAKHRVQMIEGDENVFTLHLANPSKRANLADHHLPTVDGEIAGGVPAQWLKALRGSHVELILKPTRFLFRRVELPRQATEFLDGIIRSQIDRLTPWGPNAAIYHWTEPVEAANQQIVLNVTATARVMVAPFVEALAKRGAATIAISTTATDSANNPVAITVFQQRAGGAMERRRLSRILAIVLLVAGLAAGVSVSAASIVVGQLDSQRQDLTRRIAERRAAMRLAGAAGSSAQALLEARKHATPSSVVVIEALSRLLPDHTYVTELRIEGDRLQVTGITRDAPSLIQLIEQSPHFTRATFFAPTTQSAGDPGERYHIEARIKPFFGF